MSESFFDFLKFHHVEAGDILAKNLRAPAIVVGPNDGSEKDPTLLFTSYLLAKSGGGKLFIVDPQEEMLFSDDTRGFNNQQIQPGNVIAGCGDIQKHLKQLEIFRNSGIPGVIPEWLGKGSNIHQIALPSNSVRTIIDHHTSVYLMEYLSYKDILHSSESRKNFLLQTFQEYARILSKRGRLLLQSHTVEHASIKTLSELLTASGFSINHHSVKDCFTLQISPDVINNLSNYHGALRYPVEEITRLDIENSGNKAKIHLYPKDYHCSDFFVCTR